MKALAKREGVTQRYIAHLLKLASDVIQAINAGSFPAQLTFDHLKNDLLLHWEALRKAFGIAAHTR